MMDVSTYARIQRGQEFGPEHACKSYWISPTIWSSIVMLGPMMQKPEMAFLSKSHTSGWPTASWLRSNWQQSWLQSKSYMPRRWKDLKPKDLANTAMVLQVLSWLDFNKKLHDWTRSVSTRPSKPLQCSMSSRSKILMHGNASSTLSRSTYKRPFEIYETDELFSNIQQLVPWKLT